MSYALMLSNVIWDGEEVNYLLDKLDEYPESHRTVIDLIIEGILLNFSILKC